MLPSEPEGQTDLLRADKMVPYGELMNVSRMAAYFEVTLIKARWL
jgi:hypothetical protein